MMEYLQELSEALGVSGHEDSVRKIILRAIDGHVQDIRIDAVGTLTCFKKGESKKTTGIKPLRVMLDAHMDEVGFMVTGWDDGGLIRFLPVAASTTASSPACASRSAITPSPASCSGSRSIRAAIKRVKVADLRIDIGAGSKDEVAALIKRGDRVAFSSKYMEIGETTIRGKSLDDRAGCSC